MIEEYGGSARRGIVVVEIVVVTLVTIARCELASEVFLKKLPLRSFALYSFGFPRQMVANWRIARDESLVELLGSPGEPLDARRLNFHGFPSPSLIRWSRAKGCSPDRGLPARYQRKDENGRTTEDSSSSLAPGPPSSSRSSGSVNDNPRFSADSSFHVTSSSARRCHRSSESSSPDLSEAIDERQPPREQPGTEMKRRSFSFPARSWTSVYVTSMSRMQPTWFRDRKVGEDGVYRVCSCRATRLCVVISASE